MNETQSIEVKLEESRCFCSHLEAIKQRSSQHKQIFQSLFPLKIIQSYVTIQIYIQPYVYFIRLISIKKKYPFFTPQAPFPLEFLDLSCLFYTLDL